MSANSSWISLCSWSISRLRAICRKRTPGRSVLGIARITRILKLAAGALGFLLYVWFAAVRFAPTVKRRKRVRHRR
jgi:hypothetical protein